jgi:hypothetical protein
MWLLPLLAVVVVAAVLGASVILIVWMDSHTSRKRAGTFMKVADEMGFDYNPNGIGGRLGDISSFDLCAHGETRWFRNVMHGQAKGVEVCVFDYQYTTGSARHPRCWHQTAVAFRVPDLNLPDFGLRAAAWKDRFGPATDRCEIVLESQEGFSERYQLFGEDAGRVRQLFTREMLDYFAAHPAVHVEAHGDRLLVAWQARRTSPEALRELVEAGFEVLARLRGGGREIDK